MNPHNTVTLNSAAPKPTLFSDIPVGTIFRYARGQAYYIKTQDCGSGIGVNLETGAGVYNIIARFQVVPLARNESITIRP